MAETFHAKSNNHLARDDVMLLTLLTFFYERIIVRVKRRVMLKRGKHTKQTVLQN